MSYYDDVENLSVDELCSKLSEERGNLRDVRAALRDAEDALPVVRARAVHALIESRRYVPDDTAVGGSISLTHSEAEKALGPNESARERAILLFLEDDPDYDEARAGVRDARSAVEDATDRVADIELALRRYREVRADEERKSRDRMSDALLRVGSLEAVVASKLAGISEAIGRHAQTVAESSGRF